jgi:hypothetical protein
MRATKAPLMNVPATGEYCTRLILQIKIPGSVARLIETILKVTNPVSEECAVRRQNPKPTDISWRDAYIGTHWPSLVGKLFSSV